MTDSTPGTARNHSKRNRIVRSVGAMAAVATLGLVAACSSDSVTAPEMARSNSGGLVGSTLTTLSSTANKLLNVTGLLRTKPLTSSIVRSGLITQGGGRIEIPELGFRLDIPAGAIPTNTMTITVTALPGSMVAYDFQPHGTRFLKPLSIRQDLQGTNWSNSGVKGTLTGGYFKDQSQLSLFGGTAKLDETFPVTLESSRLSFNIVHFSGYMVATGRAEDPSPNAAPF